MIYSSMFAHSNPLFRDLKLSKLSDIHFLQLLSFVYDCVNHMTPDFFSDYFRHVSDLHSICTRQAIRDDLFLDRRQTIVSQLDKCLKFKSAGGGIKMTVLYTK